MQGYSYKSRSDAWVCGKCSALVDDPVLHNDAHRELVDVLHRWTGILDRATAQPGHPAPGDLPDVLRDSPRDVPADPAGGPSDRGVEQEERTWTGPPAWAPEHGVWSGGSH